MKRLAIVALFIAGHVQAQEFIARTISIQDGDTVEVLTADNVTKRLRLGGIDAPESNMPYGTRAKISLSELIFGRTVRVEVLDAQQNGGKDRYGRLVARVWLNGQDINLEQINRGMAWAYRAYLKDQSYIQAEELARQQNKGLWSMPDPTPPWEWRKQNRRNNSQLSVDNPVNNGISFLNKAQKYLLATH